MTAAKKYDFDNWDEAQELAILREYAGELNQVRHIIVGNRVVFEMPDRKIVELPLTVTARDMIELMETSQGEQDTIMLMRLLDRLGEKDTSERLGTYHLSTLAKVATTYFELVGKVTELSLGK